MTSFFVIIQVSHSLSGSARKSVGKVFSGSRGRPCASPMPRQGQYAVDIVAEICPVGQSGWHGARPYTDGAVTHSNQHRAITIIQTI